jgi:NAD(P)H-dependent flavin oxidoreductase YrpB (nitropropane dioxygenase family)
MKGTAMNGDPLHTKICDMFGIEFPIFAFSHCKDVVAAVTNAGGLGVLGELARGPDEIAQDIAWIRERVGDKPFGVDLVFPASAPPSADREQIANQIPEEHKRFVASLMERYDIPEPGPAPSRPEGAGGGLFSQEAARKQLDAVLDVGVPLFVAGLGNPAFIVEAAHAKGIKVAGLIGRTRQARREVEAGVDVLIAQGYDAGGHTGDIGTFTLIPQVVAVAGTTPVLAAGGVGTGRHLAAALCLGAAGVWTGTLWLASRESDADMIIKEKILAATEDDTVRTRASSGKPMRQIKSQWSVEWEAPGAPPALPLPLQGQLVAEVERAIRQHKIEPLMWSPAGQVIGAIHEIKPCRDIIYDMVDEAHEVFEGLGEPAGSPA